MPTADRIRQLCERVITAKGEELERTLMELANAIDSYNRAQDVNGNKADKAAQS